MIASLSQSGTPILSAAATAAKAPKDKTKRKIQVRAGAPTTLSLHAPYGTVAQVTEKLAAIWRIAASIVERLPSANPEYLAAALALYIASLFIAGARWRTFIRTLGGKVGLARATLATLGGISAANLTPSIRLGGEACRVALVRLTGTTTWQQATIAAVWDRFSELPPIIVLAAVALFPIRHLVFSWQAASIIGVAATLLFITAATGTLRRAGVRAAAWREKLAIGRVSGRVFASGVGYSTLLWLQDVLRLTCAARAFGVLLPPTKIAALSIVAMIGGLVPGVGGLGPVEGGLLSGLVAFGIDLPTAAAVTAAERAISYGFSTAAGALVITLLGGRSLWTVSRSPVA
jgi:uncharacterized membrane protein YbhN (UPF0104 family)